MDIRDSSFSSCISTWNSTDGSSNHVLVVQSCLTLCDPMDCNPPHSSVHRIRQARILEWVVIPFPRGSSQPRDWTWSPAWQVDSWPLSHQGSPGDQTRQAFLGPIKAWGLHPKSNEKPLKVQRNIIAHSSHCEFKGLQGTSLALEDQLGASAVVWAKNYRTEARDDAWNHEKAWGGAAFTLRPLLGCTSSGILCPGQLCSIPSSPLQGRDQGLSL